MAKYTTILNQWILAYQWVLDLQLSIIIAAGIR